MNEFAKMDVFFIITSAAVAVLAVLLAVLLGYLIKIARDVKQITRKAKDEAELISQDLSDLRENIRDEGVKAKHFISFFNHLRGKKKN